MSPDIVTRPPFLQEYRASGLLLHVTSLPSPYGIGDVGPAAYSWIDRLHEAGQRWWQALPLGPTGYGNSPYQSLSSFAGNDLLISPELLVEDELLRPDDCKASSFPETVVDYDAVIPGRREAAEVIQPNHVDMGHQCTHAVDAPAIAALLFEDLGVMTPDVTALRDEFHLPGTRVLQFAFDGSPDNPHLPRNYVTNAVVYTGTHDNPTTRGWFEELPDYQRQNLWTSLERQGGASDDAAPALMEMAWSSMAALAMAPLQDVLNLGTEARMNIPGRTDGNWRWRCTEEMLSDPPFERLRDVTKGSNRMGVLASSTSLDDAVFTSPSHQGTHDTEVTR